MLLCWMNKIKFEKESFFPNNLFECGTMWHYDDVGSKKEMHLCWKSFCVSFVCVGMTSDHGQNTKERKLVARSCGIISFEHHGDAINYHQHFAKYSKDKE